MAALLALGCADPPAAPTPPPEPPAAAVSMETDKTSARVGDVVTFTFRLTRALDRNVDVWTESTTPAGETTESPIPFEAGETAAVYSTGYLPESWIGTWTTQIQGDRLPAGVVLGEPASATWTVVP